MNTINKHIGYGLLYIILLPVAFVLGLGLLSSLVSAFANSLLLFQVFIMAGFIVYTIATLVFYNRAIRQQLTCKSSLRDLIRLNAFIIILPALLLIFLGVSIALHPKLINETISQMKTMQPSIAPLPDGILVMLIKSLYFLAAYAIVILIHIIYTFKLLKQAKPLFVP